MLKKLFLYANMLNVKIVWRTRFENKLKKFYIRRIKDRNGKTSERNHLEQNKFLNGLIKKMLLL